MDGAKVSTIIERLNRLERQNRRLKMGALIVGLIVGAAFLVGQVKPEVAPKVVTAGEFVLVDVEGRRRADLSADADRAVLALYDANGTDVGATLSTGKDDGASLVLSVAGKPEPRVVLDVLPECPGRASGTRLVLYDAVGKYRAGLTVEEGEGPGLHLYSKAGKRQALLGVNADDKPGLVLYDAAGKPVTALP